MKHLVVVMALLGILVFSGCIHIASRDDVDQFNQIPKGLTMKNVIEAGDSVTLYYKGTLENGSVFDETSPGQPATFQVGVGSLIKGFDDGLLGMKVGESKHIEIPAVDAYGEVDPAAIITVPQQQLRDANIIIVPGARINSSRGQGIITAINADTNTVEINFNHPLAGKNLIFDVNIVKIEG